jgi:hypothetical protein
MALEKIKTFNAHDFFVELYFVEIICKRSPSKG